MYWILFSIFPEKYRANEAGQKRHETMFEILKENLVKMKGENFLVNSSFSRKILEKNKIAPLYFLKIF